LSATLVGLGLYGLGTIAAWAGILAIVGRGTDPLLLRQAWLPAGGYALAWPILGAGALAIMIVGRLRS